MESWVSRPGCCYSRRSGQSQLLIPILLITCYAKLYCYLRTIFLYIILCTLSVFLMDLLFTFTCMRFLLNLRQFNSNSIFIQVELWW